MDMEVHEAMNRDFLEKMMLIYGICGFTPQPANPHLRNMAKIIDARPSDRACVEDLVKYLELNGISGTKPPGLTSPPRCATFEKTGTGGTAMTPGNLIVRPAAPEDAAALLEIYAPYVEKTAVTFEYAVPSAEAFAGRVARTLERYPYLAAEAEGRILGYAYAGPFKERAAYDWAVETTVYVREGERRRGIGRRLYEVLEGCLAAQGILNVNACIACPEREDEYLTRDSVDFHRRLGWRLAGEFRQCGCKFGRWYNMVWMEKHIGEHREDPLPVRPFPEILHAGLSGEKGLTFS